MIFRGDSDDNMGMGKRAIVATASAVEPTCVGQAADGAASTPILAVLDAYFSRRISRHWALDGLLRLNAPYYIISAFTVNPAEVTNRRFAAEFGGFRACWSRKDGRVLTYGESLNEDGATSYAECLARCDPERPAWVEHQNPSTGEWRRW